MMQRIESINWENCDGLDSYRRLDMLIILHSECMSAWPVHMALHEQESLWRYFLEQAAHPRGHHLLDTQQQHHLILLLVLFWVLMMAKHCAIE